MFYIVKFFTVFLFAFLPFSVYAKIEKPKIFEYEKSAAIRSLEGQCDVATYYTNHLKPNYTRDMPHTQNRILKTAIDSAIYNVAYTIYSPEFAQKYNLSQDPQYISKELNEGIDLMEFRAESSGEGAKCQLNLLIKKNLGLDVPDQSIFKINGFKSFPLLNGGFMGNTGSGGKAVEIDDKKRYYQRNIVFNGYHGSGILEYNKDAYKGYDYFSLAVYCDNSDFMSRKNPKILFKKIGGKDYRKVLHYDKSEFKVFHLPNDFAHNVIVPLMDLSRVRGHANIVRLAGLKKLPTCRNSGSKLKEISQKKFDSELK